MLLHNYFLVVKDALDILLHPRRTQEERKQILQFVFQLELQKRVLSFLQNFRAQHQVLIQRVSYKSVVQCLSDVDPLLLVNDNHSADQVCKLSHLIRHVLGEIHLTLVDSLHKF